MGAAFSHTITENDIVYNKQSIIEELNDIFTYKETITAMYGDMMFRMGKKVMLKMGVRGEFTSTKGTSEFTGNSTDRNKFNLFPTFYLRYLLNKKNAFNLSFASRVTRPSYSTVNPFIRYLNEFNIVTGNPYLNPEKSYIAELGYTLNNNFTITATYRYTDDIIGRITEIDEGSKITSYIWGNYMKNQIVLFNISYRFRELPWLESYITNNIYNLRTKSNAYKTPLKSNQWAYLVFVNNSIFFNEKKTLIGQLSGQFQTSEKTVDRETNNKYRVNLGLKYTLLKGKLELGTQIQNLISNDTKGTIYSNDIEKKYTEETLRVFRISVTYNFGSKLQTKTRIYSNSDIDKRL